MWTREHEMQNSYPMQMSQHRVQIGLDEKNIQNFGTIELLLATQASQRRIFQVDKTEDQAQGPMNRIVLMDYHHFTKLENLIFNLNSKIWEYLHTILEQQVAHKIVL